MLTEDIFVFLGKLGEGLRQGLSNYPLRYSDSSNPRALRCCILIKKNYVCREILEPCLKPSPSFQKPVASMSSNFSGAGCAAIPGRTVGVRHR